MKVDFSQEIKTLSGESFKQDDKPVTIGVMCVDSLLANEEQDQAGGQEKMKRWEISKKIYNQAEVELTVEDIALIKERVGKILITPLVGAINDLLESNN